MHLLLLLLLVFVWQGWAPALLPARPKAPRLLLLITPALP
jgi:hypothetical protein